MQGGSDTTGGGDSCSGQCEVTFTPGKTGRVNAITKQKFANRVNSGYKEPSIRNLGWLEMTGSKWPGDRGPLGADLVGQGARERLDRIAQGS